MFPRILKGWRTLIANFLMAILPIVESLRSDVHLEEELVSVYTLFVIIINLLLRMVTDSPVGEKR